VLPDWKRLRVARVVAIAKSEEASREAFMHVAAVVL
jgi:hypothetical protein